MDATATWRPLWTLPLQLPLAGLALRRQPATCCCEPLALHRKPALFFAPESGPAPADAAPLSAPEVLELLRSRWQASYDLQLITRRGRLYLQVMWGYLEQQSFPMTSEEYGEKLDELVANLNGLGVTEQVRSWLSTTTSRLSSSQGRSSSQRRSSSALAGHLVAVNHRDDG